MNDKCAAGTGRFLEQTAARLGVPLDELGPRALTASGAGHLEHLHRLRRVGDHLPHRPRRRRVDAILRGLHRSLASRVGAMVKTVGLRPPLMLSGGVSRNPAFRSLLGEILGQDPMLPPHPQLAGALGAALLALGPPSR